MNNFITFAAITHIFYYSQIKEVLLYFFVENILVIAVMLSIFYFMMKAFLQFQEKKRLQAEHRNSNNGKLL